MAVVHNIMDYMQLYEAVQATGTYDSVASAIQSGAAVQSGNAVITAFSSIAGGAGTPVTSYDSALQVAKAAEALGASAAAVYTAAGTVLKNTATGVVKMAGKLTMTLPAVAAAAAPLAGVALGADLYAGNPALWTKISQTLLPFCYEEGKVEAFCDFVTDAETGLVKPVVLVATEIINALKRLFNEEGISDPTVGKVVIPGFGESPVMSALQVGKYNYSPINGVFVPGVPNSTTWVAVSSDSVVAVKRVNTETEESVIYRQTGGSQTIDGRTAYYGAGNTAVNGGPLTSSELSPKRFWYSIYGNPEYGEYPAGTSAPAAPVEPTVWPFFPIIIIPDPAEPEQPEEVPIPVTPITPLPLPAPEPTPLLPEHVPDPTPEKPEEWPEEEPWPTTVPFPLQPTEPNPDPGPDPDWPEVMPWPLPENPPSEWPTSPEVPEKWPEEFPPTEPWPRSPEQWPEEVPWPDSPPEDWPEEVPWPETPEDWPEEVPWPVPWPENWPTYPPSWPETWPEELPWPSSPEDWPEEVPWPLTPPEWWPYDTPWPESPDQWPEPIPWPMPPSWPIPWPDDVPYPWPFPYPEPSPNPYPDPKKIDDPKKQVDPYIDPWPYPWPDPYPDPAPNPDPYRDPSQPRPNPEPSPEPDPDPNPIPEPTDPYPTPPRGTPTPPIPPIIPLPFSSTTGLISVYHPTQSELLSFAQWLWVTWQDATIDKIWNNPFDGVITLFELYCTPTDVGRKTIRSGFLDSNVSSETISRYTSIDCGSIAVPEYYGNYFDYAPYSKCHIYLPFIGIVELNVDDVVGHGVNVTYRIDEYNGSCIALITCAKSTTVNGTEVDYSTIVYQFSGNCAVELPLAGGSQAAIKAGMIEAAAWGLGSVISGVITGGAGGGVGIGASIANNLAQGAASAVHSVVSAKSSVQHSGSFGSSYGAMGAKIPYIIVTRPKQIQVANYNALYGYQAHKMVRIGDCTGYLRCREVHVISPTASDDEKAQIEQLLKMGVYVTE